MPLPCGHLILDRYRIVSVAGSGGQATVYRALEETSGETVAVKVAGDADEAARLQREGEVLQRLACPRIVGWRDQGYDSSIQGLVLVLDWLPGVLLEEFASQVHGRRRDVGRIVMHVAEALAALHQQGFVMRDLTLTQVMVREQAGEVSATLMDLGMLRVLGSYSDLTAPGLVAGTPGFTAPELLLGRAVDERTDTYSLACVAWRLLTGQPPFLGPSPQVTYALQLLGPPDLPKEGITGSTPDQDPVLCWLRSGLAVRPEDRPGPPMDWAKGLEERLESDVDGM